MSHVHALIRGRATPQGTAAHLASCSSAFATAHAAHFRALTLSSVAAGTYLGASDADTDASYRRALARALALGINVFDTAVSYRYQRAERVLGGVLREATARGVSRSGLFVCSKAGYLTADSDPPPDAHAYLEEAYFAPGIVDRTQLVARSHCITPRFLAHQLAQSRQNLAVETLDVFYLHNPETQLEAVSRPVFLTRVGDAFTYLEQAVAEGKIGWYGVATWDGLRRPPDHPAHLSLRELLDVARDVGGPGHHFAALQLPFNLAMPEAYVSPCQDGVSLLEAARRADMFVSTSASILQGRLASLGLAFPDSGLESSAQHALQLVRSTPGVTSAIVGMSREEHVIENVAVTRVPKLAKADVASLLELPD